MELKDKIESYQHLWTLKARGIGFTTFLTRYLGWKCTVNDDLAGKDIFIITGTRSDLGNEIKTKIENLFIEKFPEVVHDSKHMHVFINKTRVKAFPSRNLKDMRGYTDVAYLFIDEGDSFIPSERRQIEYVITSYEEKSKGKIILVGTAGESGGLFETIQNDPKSIYHKHYMLADKGRGKVLEPKFLDNMKRDKPAFYAREYEGKFGYGLGNVFPPEEIEQVIVPTEFKVNYNCPISMGIDPGFGSSKFGITILQLEDNILKVIYAKEYDRPNYENMIRLIAQLRVQYKPNKIFVDAAKPDFIKSLKIQFNETTDYERIIEMAKKDKQKYDNRMFVIPVAFNEWGKELLGRFQHVISKQWFLVPNVYSDLITQMRMARFKDNGNLDKDETGSNNTYDCFDSTRLALKQFYMK